MTRINAICPMCIQTLNVRCYEDPSVGIDFDFDVLEEGTNCICDADDPKVYQAQAAHLQPEYDSRFEERYTEVEFEEFFGGRR